MISGFSSGPGQMSHGSKRIIGPNVGDPTLGTEDGAAEAAIVGTNEGTTDGNAGNERKEQNWMRDTM